MRLMGLINEDEGKGKKRRRNGGGNCICIVCGKATRDKYNLNRHMLTHSGRQGENSRLYFTKKNWFNNYYFILGVKPYSCDICIPVKGYFDTTQLRFVIFYLF